MKIKKEMKIVKKIAGLGMALLFAVSLNAQTAKEAFLSMPESLLPDMNLYARMDLVDLYNAGQQAVIANSFNDTIALEKLTSDYLFLKTGKGSLQIMALQMINESWLYCLIHTVCGPVCDSRMDFYSISWNHLNSDTFITPATKTDFINENPDCPALNISLMQWVYDPETATLQQRYNTPDYLSLEDQNTIRPFIKERMREYRWNGIRFE
ncbi:hypothetical protein FACS189421_00740 [Bacteroidia bacterium]|nr:hypothetical protein FACS189421_00740 [Bacteroidia bacterium]GHT03097.1 hypothetical protein FACS189423_03210 [Bacteroidia bacterium]